MWTAEFRSRTARCLCWLALAFLLPGVARAQVDSSHARVELLADVRGVVPGQPFTLGVALALDRGWHTYWQNPGDSGLPVRVAWDLPAGFTAGPIEWPYPQQVSAPPVVTYGYEGMLLLPVVVTPSADLAGPGPLTLRARVSYLVCKDVCLPEQADVALSLPLLALAQPDPAGQRRLADARARLPRSLPDIVISASAFGEHYYVYWPAAAGRGDVSFFPDHEGQIRHSVAQARTREGSRWRLSLAAAEPAVDRLSGVLVSAGGWDAAGQVRALRVDTAVTPLATPPSPAPAPVTAPVGMSLLWACAFAVLGGLILNLMPCVFPVLSVKVLSFIQLAHGDPGRVRRHGLAFLAGVMVSFWLLAGLLLALRAAGGGVGWGFQLQSPGFVAAMALLLTAVGLNLMGVFEVGLGLSRLAGSAPQPAGYPGSFFTGTLAVLVATPCTAPFMGAALGFALARPAWEALTIFTALGIGMALPYLVLAEMPGLLARLPRPGAWMVTLRQALAFPLFATAAWLAWVLGRQTGVDAVGLLLLAALGVGFAAWGLGHVQRGVRRWLPGSVVVVGLGLAAVLGFAAAMRPDAMAVAPRSGAGLDWQAWSPEAVERHRAAGERVFVDFTAAWCITCQVNKRVALGTAAVAARFAELGIVPLKADWTRYDPAITQTLASFGRSGVPLYVYYDGSAPPRVLPSVLTPGIVLEALGD